MEIANAKKWYDLLNRRYYKHLGATYHISWSDTLDKNGNILLETQVKVALLNECIPTKNHTIYILTLYHTTNTVLIQGNKKQM